jgi:hypothetical protein
MEETLIRVWEDLVGRVGGPLTLRLVIQPTVATILALRAGLNDSRQGRTPYFWNILLNLDQRKDLLREGWKDVGKLFIMAVVLDTVYQLIVARWIYPLETLIVAVVLAILPYVLFRGLASRLARRLRNSTRLGSDARELR